MTGIDWRVAAQVLPAMALALNGLPARAQDLPPFEINPERVHYMSTQRCARAGTYIVPSLYLNVLARSRTAKEGKTSRRVFTRGLEKGELQALSRALYDDFVAKLRAGGARVLTYDDIKADLAELPRKQADEALGMPLRSGRRSFRNSSWPRPATSRRSPGTGRARPFLIAPLPKAASRP